MKQNVWNVVPRLGVRGRLACRARVNGSPPREELKPCRRLATQVPQLVETLREAGRLDSLQATSFPPRFADGESCDIATGVRESARFYVNCTSWASILQCFDVGGGLGVDYASTRSQSDCSVNYRPE
ncbi:hypothetical protein ACNKHU_17790 [Shigella flexneri]